MSGVDETAQGGDDAVEKAVERVYRDKVGVIPYSSLSVVLLCEGAGVTRKAFYRRFSGKDDVLRHVFERDVVVPQIELCRLLSFEKMSSFAPQMEQRMFAAVRSDAAFYRNVVNAGRGGETAFTHMAAVAFDKFNRIMLQEFDFEGSLVETAYVSSFFAEGKARFMARWIREGFLLSEKEAARLYSRMVMPFWKTVID